jgi:acetyl-CoA synthetase
MTSPTEAFAAARAQLMAHAGDPDAAQRTFRWPELPTFNWACDWVDTLAGARPALVLVRDGAPTETATFAELGERSRRVARYLRDHGVARGDRILVMLPNVAALFETMLAAIRLGAVVIPATTQLTPEDIDDRIERGRVRHVVTDAAGAAKVRGPQRLVVRLVVGGQAEQFAPFDDARAAAPELARVDTRPDEPLLLYFTSGTTAKPKLVLHTHASYPIGHLSTMHWLGLREGDVHHNISSPGWAKHAWSSLFAPWNAGATVLVHDAARFSAARTLAVLREHRVSTLCAPPTVWRMLIQGSLGERPEALRELASAGEPLNPEVIETVARAWGLTVRDGYGQTETTAQIGNPPGRAVRPGSMGKPLPGYDIVLLDAAGDEVDEGEVAIRLSPRPLALMAGYEDDEARTREALGGAYYRTGDEARRDADGYFHFVGRGDDVFKSSDYRISPFELESVLVEHELVAEAAVVPSPEPTRLAVPKAFVVLTEGTSADAATARAIFDHVKQRLAPYKRVRRLEFAALPKTISGKIRRVELRKQEEAARAQGRRGEREFWWEDFEAPKS